MNVENSATAPRTVPVKWNLVLSADDTPVSDTASFVAAKSYAGTCRMFFVEFSDGQTSPKILFHFK